MQLLENESGTIEIRYRGRLMRWTEIAPHLRAASTPVLTPAPVIVRPEARRLQPTVSADRP